jgi:hypothetical protein
LRQLSYACNRIGETTRKPKDFVAIRLIRLRSASRLGEKRGAINMALIVLVLVVWLALVLLGFERLLYEWYDMLEMREREGQRRLSESAND